MYLEILRIVGAENKIISLYETISNIRYNDVILYLFKWSFPPEDNYGHSTLKVVIAFTYAQACALVLANYLPYLENIERVRAGMVVC